MTGSSAGIRSKIRFRQSVVRRNAGTDEKCGEFPFLGKRPVACETRCGEARSDILIIYTDQVGSDQTVNCAFDKLAGNELPRIDFDLASHDSPLRIHLLRPIRGRQYYGAEQFLRGGVSWKRSEILHNGRSGWIKERLRVSSQWIYQFPKMGGFWKFQTSIPLIRWSGIAGIALETGCQNVKTDIPTKVAQS